MYTSFCNLTSTSFGVYVFSNPSLERSGAVKASGAHSLSGLVGPDLPAQRVSSPWDPAGSQMFLSPWPLSAQGFYSLDSRKLFVNFGFLGFGVNSDRFEILRSRVFDIGIDVTQGPTHFCTVVNEDRIDETWGIKPALHRHFPTTVSQHIASGVCL